LPGFPEWPIGRKIISDIYLLLEMLSPPNCLIMAFKVDKQTIRDIELFSNKKNLPSIFSYYNRTVTKGGQELLYEIFNAPSSDFEFLSNRKKEISIFSDSDCYLHLNSRSIDFIEYYLKIRRVPLKANIIDATYDGLSQKFKPDNDYFVITESIIHITQLLQDLDCFIKSMKSYNLTKTFESHLNEILEFINSKTIKELFKRPPKRIKDLWYIEINKLDNYFRIKKKESLRNLLTIVYEIDFLQAMGLMIKSNELTLPIYINSSKPVFKAIDAFHPFLDQPIKNSFQFVDNLNLCFLTGPNMSGKSTFLKTVGILIYLSHLGLPVPAKEFKTSIFEGLYTTINLSDDLNLGYSHFYSEVNRVKEIATKLSLNMNLVIIFDELFRGTNVKDAYDASLIIISSLSKIHSNYFFISTHILEVAENLSNSKSIIFRCFESELINQKPVYDFKLKEGISKERVGMMIIKNEDIIQILDEVIKKQNN
jgi:DNA mismatch repair protein MutS